MHYLHDFFAVPFTLITLGALYLAYKRFAT